MPRYCVERELPSGSSVLTGGMDPRLLPAVIANNFDDGVTWIHSYVTADHKRSFCIYDAPTPEAIRRASNRNKLPIKQIIEIRVLDPYSCD
jgi:hypothetical protein